MKLALICPDYFTMWVFWRGLTRTLVGQGHEVHLLCARDKYMEKLQRSGAICTPIHISRFIGPLEDMRLFAELWAFFVRERPDIVSNFMVKANIFGAIAAKLARRPVIVDMILGLGFFFSGENSPPKYKIMQKLLLILYRVAFRLCTKVCFVNSDDLNQLVSLGVVHRKKAIAIKSGIGIDLSEFSRDQLSPEYLKGLKKQLGLHESTHVVLMVVARIVWPKGIREFVEASKMVHAKRPSARFLLVGEFEDDSPQAVPREFIKRSVDEGFSWLGFREDIKELMALSDVFVLPSYYGEGLPQVLIEAMAMGNPLVTTLNVGCKEAVEHGKNGFLVPPKNPLALGQAIDMILGDEELKRRFGEYSSIKAKREFDQRKINKRIITELYGLNCADSTGTDLAYSAHDKK